jgi:hypothetical protein
MIQICTFKEKGKEGVEGKTQLGGQWKVPNLMTIQMNPMFGGQWGIILFALLNFLFFATSHYVTGMQLVVICNYLGDVCNYKFGIV